MLRSMRTLFAVAFAAGFAVASTSSWAEQGSKEASVSDAKKTPASSSDFEENRRLHTQKSKENNDKKGAE